jgi:hypothetical protein
MYNASLYYIVKSLGLNPDKHLPAMGVEPRVIHGVKYWVEPRHSIAALTRPGISKRKPHRVMCECPSCGKKLSAGRLPQHIRRCPGVLSAAERADITRFDEDH